MSFWIGFVCGVAAAWTLSIVALVLIARPWRTDNPSPLSGLERDFHPGPDQQVFFTHLTGLGEHVKGRDF